MVLGVALYGILAGNLAVFFSRQADAAAPDSPDESPPETAQRDEPLIAKLEAIEARLIRMEEQLGHRTGQDASPPPPSL